MESVELDLLVDTRAMFSVVPASQLTKLGVSPARRMEFELADGSTIERDVGEVRFRYNGRSAISPVVFGGETDSAILGVVSMETLGLEVDPLRKILRPTKLILYGCRPTCWLVGSLRHRMILA
jgi:predicted aspartyl protease